jgi:geranylgeranyl reductase family protein
LDDLQLQMVCRPFFEWTYVPRALTGDLESLCCMMPVRCDVAVVGAGPAGCVVAAQLSRRGARVTLVDPSHPREKACGGGLTQRALLLARDTAPLAHTPAVTVRSARFLDTPRKRSVDVPFDDDSVLAVFSRATLDLSLFEAAAHAGATIVRSRVAEIAGGPVMTVRTSTGERIDADFIVGADGPNSLVRRKLSTPFGRHDLSIATGFYAHGVTSDEIVVEMLSDPPGYIWSFPRPDHLAIGICAQATDTTVDAVRAVLVRWIEATGIARGARLERYSWPIPSLSARSFDSLELGGRGWLTVGDASGLVDPITREGIYFALQSANVAADVLSAGVGEESARRYAERVRAEIVDELRMAARVKAGFFKPAFAHLLIDALGSSRRVRAVMRDVIAGTQPYRSLARRLLGTFEIGLAWRWFREAQRPA